ncbi:MAG: DNA polymerase III subunit gamma/tau [Chitinophagales bacterium]|nr:DNA polymerase III subunit gamma/tau [Chitinophagales bacterium]
MSSYLVSARKYRPGKFKEMLGQEHVSNTLRNAIRSGRLAHAFLFCGPRGVGKTTAARILAKTINCQNLTEEFEACGVCPSCTAFAQNASFNIYELDAASNNTVDDIRELVNQVRFPPQYGKYKIYIIDEVHMLSQAAFNAFLKTLEEPPPYCKFILATTEKHKILPTILSRCQIFDFRRIPVETIVKHLREICRVEQVEFEDDALHIIAQKADGGMRDALSMFDRLVSFGGGKLMYADVLENLSVLDYDYFFKITDFLLAENVAEVMRLFDEILQKGFEGDDFIIGLCEHFRNLLFCKSEPTAALLGFSASLKDKYLQQASLADGAFLVSCLSIGNECDVRYKQSKNKRLTVELALIKMCFVNRLVIPPQTEEKKKTDSIAFENGEAHSKESNSFLINSRNTNTPASISAQSEAAEKPLLAEAPPPQSPLFARRTARVAKADEDLSPMLQSKQQADNDILKEASTPANGEQFELSQENIEILWRKFAALLPDEKKGAKALLTHNLPQWKKDQNLLEVALQSHAQREMLETLHGDLKKFYKSHTGADLNIKFKTLSNQNDTQTRKIYYTPEDKFKRLLEINPLLAELVRRFDLNLSEDD